MISITDGQIYLESQLFFAGQRPAVNVGLSVSRVGGAAQTKAMKKAGGTLRLDLAQYREMKIFTQFSSDLDPSVKRQLIYGGSLMKLLVQDRYKPYSQSQQIILLLTGGKHLFEGFDEEEIPEKVQALLEHFKAQHNVLCARIDQTGIMSDEDKAEILKISEEFLKKQ